MLLRSNQQRQLHSDLLRTIVKLCMERHVLETGRWQMGFLRGVCRQFRDWCDELAPVLLQELDYELCICNTSVYHEAQTQPHAWSEMLLDAAPRLAIDAPVFKGVPYDEEEGKELIVLDLEPTALLTCDFLEEAACLRELKLQQLPPQLASTNPDVLLALPFLKRLTIDLLADYECDAGAAWEWLGHGLARQQSLQELEMWAGEEDMRDALDLPAFGACLPASLTSLSLGLTPEEGDRTQDALADLAPADLSEAFGHLSKLQRLRLCGVLAGPQQIPPALTGLTHLGLHSNVLLRLGPCLAQLTGLHHLDLSHCGLQAWPEGLPALTNLTYMQIQGCQGGMSEEEPPNLAALTRLQHLSLTGPPAPKCPDLSALVDLRRLELELPPSQLPELLLGPLTRLTSLILEKSTPAGLDLAACTGLQRLEVGWVTPNGTGVIGSPWTPVAGLAGLSQLTALLLRRCTLEPELDVRALTRLQELELEQCRLRRLPQGVTALTELRWLNLRRNRIALSGLEHAWLCWAFYSDGKDWDVNREARSLIVAEGEVQKVRCIAIPPWLPLTDGDDGCE